MPHSPHWLVFSLIRSQSTFGAVWSYLESLANRNPGLLKQLGDDFSSFGDRGTSGSWDIRILAQKNVQGTKGERILDDGTKTVTVNGNVYPQEAVNYYIYGVWARITGKSEHTLIDRIVAYKVLAWGASGMPERVAWARAGFHKDFRYPEYTAIIGATPSTEKYTKPIFFHLGAGRLKATDMGNGFFNIGDIEHQ